MQLKLFTFVLVSLFSTIYASDGGNGGAAAQKKSWLDMVKDGGKKSMQGPTPSVLQITDSTTVSKKQKVALLEDEIRNVREALATANVETSRKFLIRLDSLNEALQALVPERQSVGGYQPMSDEMFRLWYAEQN